VSEARKAKLAEDIARFYQYKHLPFEKPNYRGIGRLPYVPLESEIDQLISAVGKKKGVFLQLLKETGIRPGEGWNLRWIDIDSDRGTVSVAPEKNSKPRQLKISTRLMAMLNGIPRNHEYVFRNPRTEFIRSMDILRRDMAAQRKRVADRLQNPRINAITFRALRHFRATTEYHKTKDILHVMSVLGHKNIRSSILIS